MLNENLNLTQGTILIKLLDAGHSIKQGKYSPFGVKILFLFFDLILKKYNNCQIHEAVHCTVLVNHELYTAPQICSLSSARSQCP